jgi:uncharacterized OsmC-like protein
MRRAPVAGGMADIETGYAEPMSPVSCRITLRGHTIVQDKPPALHGADAGPMASELLLAGLLACQLSTFVKVAAKRRSPLRPARIEGAVHLDDAGDIERIALAWTLVGPEDASAQADTILRLTERTCTISRALKVPVRWSHAMSPAS